MFAECAHCNLDQLLISVPLDYAYHFLDNGRLSLEGECGVAVSFFNDYLINFDGDSRHLLHTLFFLLELPQRGGKNVLSPALWSIRT